MASDRLLRVSWPAGSLNIHGSPKHVRQVAAEYLMAEEAGRMRVEEVTANSEQQEKEDSAEKERRFSP
jgi:hypothetical protein